MVRLVTVGVVVMMIGCGHGHARGAGRGVPVGRANPQPILNIERRELPLQLVLGPGVEDDFTVPESATILAVHITQWRESIATGFRNAFSPFFPAPAPGGPQFTLLIDLVRPDFVPVAVTQRGAAVVATSQLQYRATLSDPAGQVIARTVGTVTARKVGVRTWEESLSSSLEVMFEDLGARLFTGAAGRPSPGAALPPPL